MNSSTTIPAAPAGYLSIREVAERTGLSVHTLRYYERIGLLDPPDRDAGGRRCYTSADLGTIALMVLMRDTGMSLTQIQAFSAMMRNGPESAAERRDLLEAHRAHVQAQVEVLCQNLSLIEYKLDLLRREERDPAVHAGWQERCLQCLQEREAHKRQHNATDAHKGLRETP